jgi:hypothetical protein
MRLRVIAGVLVLAELWALSLLRNTNQNPGPVRIVRFYATAGTVTPGEKAELCYSVQHARLVRISPSLDSAYPTQGRCIEIYPEHTTHYVLQAEGYDGTIAMRTVTLAVQDAPIVPGPVMHYAVALQDRKFLAGYEDSLR